MDSSSASLKPSHSSAYISRASSKRCLARSRIATRPPGQNARGLCNCELGMERVVQRLREEDEINGFVVDGQLFHIA